MNPAGIASLSFTGWKTNSSRTEEGLTAGIFDPMIRRKYPLTKPSP
jgi:hypothetical protein